MVFNCRQAWLDDGVRRGSQRASADLRALICTRCCFIAFKRGRINHTQPPAFPKEAGLARFFFAAAPASARREHALSRADRIRVG